MRRRAGMAGTAPLALLVLLLSGCLPPRIRTDYDPEVNWGRLRKYAWIDSTDRARDRDVSPIIERRVRRAVDRNLRELGFEPVAGTQPDFLVTAFVVGPTPPGASWRRWSAAPCPPGVWIGITMRYPFGFSPRRPWSPFRSLYFREPWGWACAYRIGIGHVWIPLHEAPDRRLPGTLVIDVLSAPDRELMWRGWAEGAFPDRDGRQVSEDELVDLVARVLRDFPPPRMRRE